MNAGSVPEERRFTDVPLLYRDSAGIHRGTTGDNRCVAVALSGSALAPVELRCRPDFSRFRAGRCRSFPVTPGGFKHFNTFPEPRFIPVVPTGIIVRLGLYFLPSYLPSHICYSFS
ncbi:hypothetical protein DPMN_048347 [Dreissena polymorpha]|uniref:Uncharacterized protein n=1 Tax=Dreissena polymorpha TaxID=45954 RepID=A0A9D4I2T5_DREPO|nr:hypothetical protein DPMN_048347 [Dreissena polymorpha]